jgi:hypothetical protein
LNEGRIILVLLGNVRGSLAETQSNHWNNFNVVEDWGWPICRKEWSQNITETLDGIKAISRWEKGGIDRD